MVGRKRPAFEYIWLLSLMFFAVDHKRTGTEDIKCESTIIWDVVSSDDNITIIVRLVSRHPQMRTVTGRYNIEVFQCRVQEARLQVHMDVTSKLKFFAVDHKRTVTEDIKCA